MADVKFLETLMLEKLKNIINQPVLAARILFVNILLQGVLLLILPGRITRLWDGFFPFTVDNAPFSSVIRNMNPFQRSFWRQYDYADALIYAIVPIVLYIGYYLFFLQKRKAQQTELFKS